MFGSRFLRFLSLLGIVLAATLTLVYRQSVEHRLRELEQAEERYVALLSESLAEDFLAVMTDLLVFAESGEIQRSVEGSGVRERTRLADSFLHFAEKKRVYDQIRLLDLEGQEIVRVNFFGEHGEIVPDEELQSKQDRYYFQEAKDLAPGQIFVSPFDLNVEDGQIEQPVKPTIRFASPVFDTQGTRRGLVVLNYRGDAILGRFARLDADSPGLAMLLNSDGYWLYDAQARRAWAWMYPDRQAESFPRQYPDLWRLMGRQERGVAETDVGMFTFAAVRPFLSDRRPDLHRTIVSKDDLSGGQRRWIVASLVTREYLATHLAELRRAMLLLGLLMTVLVVGVSWSLARYAVARERSEDALRVSEGRFRQMANSIAEVFWLSTADRRQLLYISPAFGKVWGYQPSSAADATNAWSASIHPDDRAAMVGLFGHEQAPSEFRTEFRICRADGTQRWICNQGFAVTDGSGAVIHYAGIAEDITTLKETQQQLLQSTRLAAIGEAITGLAHESRNALQRSQACLEMLSKRVSDRPEAQSLVTRTQAALRDLHSLYERVRNFAAPLQLEFVRCNLREIWRETCDDLEELVQSRHAVIQDAAAVDDDHFWLVGDPLALRQVFRNILENALAPELDADSDRSQVTLCVAWHVVGSDGHAHFVVEIQDNGPGVPPDVCERIFEPFYTTKAQGTGLGMAICRRIVAAHGGTIRARTAGLGHGLTLILELPNLGTRDANAATQNRRG